LAIKHTNEKRKTYYLHKGETKKGNARYHFSLKAEGAMDGSLPKGYEIYENPCNAQVFLRKIPEKIIDDREIGIVKKGITALTDIKMYKVDARKESIIVYTPNQDTNALQRILANFAPIPQQTDEIIREIVSYAPVLKFVLVDVKRRTFVTQRYCYLGSVDDWMNVGNPSSLNTLVHEYIKHLGKQSYFDLY
jgi:hypothetical protein